jgi:hypothetical protein
MVSADVAVREQLDQATDSLMASLRESRALNTEMRQTLERWELLTQQPNIQDQPIQTGATVLQVLTDVLGCDSRS